MRSKVYILGLALCCLFLLGKNAYVTDDAAASVYTSDNVAYTEVAPDGTIVEYYLDEYGEPYVYDENGERRYTYTEPDGIVIEYYLDENGETYIYEDGEKIYALLSLERYRVTDPEVLDILNGNGDLTSLYNNEAESRSVPSKDFDCSTGAIYTQNMDFDAASTWATANIYYGYNAMKLRVSTYPYQQRSFASGKSVNITVYLYDEVYDIWEMHTYDQDCTAPSGWGWYRTQNLTYGRFSVRSSYLSTVTLNVWLDKTT